MPIATPLEERSLNSVAKLLLERQRQGSRPGARRDGRKIALAIEGGGMRGVVSGAMVAALEQLDLLDGFDAVYGSSAGSIAGAYFIAGQARYATTIFYDELNNKEFIDPWRLLGSKPVLSLEFLLDHVCVHKRPLKTERVLRSPIGLNVVCTSVSKLTNVSLRGFKSAPELFEALRCGARIPVFAGPPVEFRGDRFLDASIYESIPYKSAIQDSATDLVMLLTRPQGNLRRTPGMIDRMIVAPYLSRIHPELGQHYLRRADHYAEEIEDITRYSAGESGPRALTIQLDRSETAIRPFEKSREKLLAAAMGGFAAVYKAFGLPAPELVEIITPVGELRSSRLSAFYDAVQPAQREEKTREIS
jgi:predicted patatin/cPLA2 family phospholipase